MEPQQQQNQQPMNDQDGSGKGSFLCRQSSTRWTPTTDQIRILKDLYYNNGVRSPSAEQIQRITARLRQYGKIEGKNVFYWFQNHKARERQKKRFTTTDHTNHLPMQRPPPAAAISGAWKTEDPIHNKYPNINPGGYNSSATPASSGVLTSVGQIGNYGYGSVTMEKSFRDCSISPRGGSSGVGGSINQNIAGWVSIDHYSTSYNFFEERKSLLNEEEQDEEGEEEELKEEEITAPAGIETLPLFPMHGEDINLFCKPNPSDSYSHYSSSGWYRPGSDHGSSRASLELSLNSYTGRSVPDSI